CRSPGRATPAAAGRGACGTWGAPPGAAAPPPGVRGVSTPRRRGGSGGSAGGSRGGSAGAVRVRRLGIRTAGAYSRRRGVADALLAAVAVLRAVLASIHTLGPEAVAQRLREGAHHEHGIRARHEV